MTRATLWALVVGVAVLAACGRPSDLPPGADGWASFPVQARPRPLVLGMSSLDPENGFADGNSKSAALDGHFEIVAPPPPPAATAVPVELPDGRFDLPTRTAQQAVADLTRASRPSASPPLRITAITWGTAVFPTDRGPRTLPAWLFTAPGALGAFAVVGVADSAIWPLPEEQRFGLGTTEGVSADGLHLTVGMPEPRTPCGGPAPVATPFATETATTVTVGLRVTTPDPAPSPGPDCADDLVLRMVEYPVDLAQPLGNRVLLGPWGAPGPAVLAVQVRN